MTKYLREFAEVTAGPFGELFNNIIMSDSGIPVINIKNLGHGQIITSEMNYIPVEQAKSLSTFSLKEGDILLGRIGKAGKFAYIMKEQEGWIQGTDCIRIRCNSTVNARYIAHCFNINAIKDQLKAHIIGCTMPSINSKAVEEIQFPLPKREKQDEVDSVLSNLYKRKICNQKTIIRIENMVKTIFEYWFLEFKTPLISSLDELQWNDTLGISIPKNWKAVPLEQVTEQITDGEHKLVETCSNGQYWLYGAGNIKENHICTSVFDKKIDRASFQRIRKRTKTEKGDILLSIAGTIGSITLLRSNLDNIEFQRSVAMIKPDPDLICSEYLYQYMISAMPQICALAKGSSQRSITLAALRKFPVLVPPMKVQKSYLENVSGLYQLVEIMIRENEELHKVYELLLNEFHRRTVE